MKLLDRINRTGTTVVMATHDAAIVDSMRKRVIELEFGKVVRDQSRGVYGYAGELTNTSLHGVPAVSLIDEGNPDRIPATSGRSPRGRRRWHTVAATGRDEMAVSLDYVVKETATNLWRNRVMAIAAVLTVAVSLSLVGTALLLRQAVKSQFVQWSNNVSLEVFMDANATPSQLASVKLLIERGTRRSHGSPTSTTSSPMPRRRCSSPPAPTAIAALTPAITPTVYRCALQNPGDAKAVGSTFTGVPGVYRAVYAEKAIRLMQKLEGAAQVDSRRDRARAPRLLARPDPQRHPHGDLRPAA